MRFNDNLWALHSALAPEILRQLEQNSGEATLKRAAYVMDGPVAVIDVAGPIDREAWFFADGQDRIRAALDAAMNDSAVNAVLLSFHSPGGVVSGTKELADHIAQCGRKKPLAAYADGLCASAAYWLAAATGRVFAPLTAQVGSIGVIAVHTSWRKAAEAEGIRRTVIFSGKYKAAGSPDKELTAEERALFQGQIDALHEIFKADIGRFMRPKGEDWAEGQTFLGQEAKERGLMTAIVADEAQAVAKLAAIVAKGAKVMDLAQLKAEYPQLLAEYKAQIEKEQVPDDACLAEAARSARAEMLALVEAVVGEEAAAKVDAVQAAGITAAQFKALSGILPRAAKTEKSARAEMLAAIEEAHGGALNAAPAQPAASALVLEAERIAQEAK